MSLSAQNIDISESFRPEELSRTDFFDFVSGSETTMTTNLSQADNEDTIEAAQPLQGFDQVNLQFFIFALLLKLIIGCNNVSSTFFCKKMRYCASFGFCVCLSMASCGVANIIFSRFWLLAL